MTARAWTINGRFLTQKMTGVQRYAREIVGALDQLVAEGHPLARGLEIEVVCPNGAVNDLDLRRITVRAAGRTRDYLWENVELPLAARGPILSLCNAGPLLARRHIVCIHDVNIYLAPSSYSRKFRALYRVVLPVLGRTAARVTTVSQFSADQISKFGVAASSKISVVPNGREHALRWRPSHSAATRSAAGENVIVAVGSPAPHKNLGMLLSLAGQLRSAGLRLAIVGALDPSVFRSHELGIAEPGVVWLGRLSDDEIAALLGNCLCLAMPSFTEGFGLPALEAMSVGCPVVVSNCASLPEICTDAALYASAAEPQQWLARFLELRRAPKLRAEMISRGRKASLKFSWTASAERYLELFAEIDGVSTDRGRGPGRSASRPLAPAFLETTYVPEAARAARWLEEAGNTGEHNH